MISLFIYILYLIILVGCCLLSLFFIVLAIRRWRKKKRFAIYTALAIVFITATCYIWTIDLLSAETTDRRKAAGAFEEDFGFKPPEAIKEIKLKNYNIDDATVHWMAFTYDSVVFHKILDHDQPLEKANFGTQQFREVTSSLGSANQPKWLLLPDHNTQQLFFKKNFLQHTTSEYCLWVSVKEKMVFLEVSYTD